MATLKEIHGSIITLDYLPVGQSHNTMEFLHKYQGQSTDYALTHGGYAVFEDEADIRGYMSYLTIKERRGYGVDGWIVRSIENMQAVSLDNGGALTEDVYFTDQVAKPTLEAIRAALNYTSGHLANINGRLDSWVMLCAQRFGLNPDEV